MNRIEKKYLDNSFILVGKTGNGKSTACRALTGNDCIEISSSHISCTRKVSYYRGTFRHLLIWNNNFTMIDTPGLDDTEGRDKDIYQDLRSLFRTKDLQIKGIFIVFSLQTNKFTTSEKNIIDKIVNLVPVKDLWKYITILVTHSYYDNPRGLEMKKYQFKEDIKNLFEKEFFQKAFKKYGIRGYFNDMNIVFTNFSDANPSIKEARELKNIIEKSLKKEPLFQYCNDRIDHYVPVLEYNSKDRKSAVLYKCTIRTITFYGQKGKKLNEIRAILDKKKEREIEKSELDPKNSFITAGVAGGVGLVALGGLAFPPLEIAAVFGYLISMGVSLISNIFGWTKVGINQYKNSDFKYDEIDKFLDETY